MYNEPDNMDVMQNIEFAVINYYREHADLTDHNVDKVYEALQRSYHKESQGKNPPRLRLTEMEQELFEAVKTMSEWRLGRGEEPEATVIKGGGAATDDGEPDADETTAEAETEDEAETVEADEDEEAEDEAESDEDDEPIELHDLTLDEMVAVFKRLRSSINTWSGSSGYGRQGYLNYVSRFIQ